MVPCALVLGMTAELVIFKGLASVQVQDMHIPVLKEREWVLATCSCEWSNYIGFWEMGTGEVSYVRQCQMDALGLSLEGNGLR